MRLADKTENAERLRCELFWSNINTLGGNREFIKTLSTAMFEEGQRWPQRTTMSAILEQCCYLLEADIPQGQWRERMNQRFGFTSESAPERKQVLWHGEPGRRIVKV